MLSRSPGGASPPVTYATEHSHNTARESYRQLSDRLNLFPQGAPPTELLFRILEVLFTPGGGRAGGAAADPALHGAAAAAVWGKPEAEARSILEGLADRACCWTWSWRGQSFVLPPPMAGFFEFSMMRVGNGYDQKLLAELFHQYLNVEEDFVKALFAGGETQLGRVFVNERGAGARNDPPGAGLRAGHGGGRRRQPHGRGHLLLPAQDGSTSAGPAPRPWTSA